MELNRNLESLAFELASDLYTPDEICDRNDITKAEVAHLLMNPGFRNMVMEYKSEWNSAASTDKRVALRAAFVEEAGLLPIHHIIHDPSATNADRIAAFKAIQTSAGTTLRKVADEQKGPGGKEGINVIINLNGERKSMVFDAQPASENYLESGDGVD